MRLTTIMLCLVVMSDLGCVSTATRTQMGSAIDTRGSCAVTQSAMIFGVITVLIVLQPLIWWRGRLGYAATICGVLVFLCGWSWIRTLNGCDICGYGWRAIDDDRSIGGSIGFSSGGGGCRLAKSASKHMRGKASETLFQQLVSAPNPILGWSRNASLNYPLVYSGRPKDVPKPWWERWGFQLVIGRGATGFDPNDPVPLTWSIAVPHWFLASLFSIVPAIWLRKTWMRRRRRKTGHCLHCNYDLRATPEGSGALLDKCPECGTPTAGRKPTASTATPPISPAD